MLSAMSKRTYGQYCGLAAALDVVGQRWALLIVRDLVPGPRRFTDLFDGLPGVSTDLLADRLRSLETAGAIRQREVRNPAPARLYELTDRGLQLARTAGELARWGSSLLPPPDKAGDYIANARWTLSMRAGRYRGGFPDGDVHILLDQRDELTLSFTGDQAQLAYGHTSAEPSLTLEATTKAMLGLLRNGPDLMTGHADDVAVTGRIDLLHPLFKALNT